MRIAIFSDIHANWEALQAAWEHSRGQKIDRYAVLGDSVGYGANPNECLAWVFEHASIHLLGNHELALVDKGVREWFADYAREAILWTAGVIDPGLQEKIPQIPLTRSEGGLTFAHSSLHEPEAFHYVNHFQDAVPSFEIMKTPLCFIGHTHRPCAICEQERTAQLLRPGVLELNPAQHYILNPGSVGQPRDSDSRLAYGIFDDTAYTFEVLRLEYEKEKAAEKIRKAGLPKMLAERLL